MTAARPWWVTSNEVSGSSLSVWLSGRITTRFPPFICMRGRPHFAAQHKVAKDDAENSWPFFFLFFSWSRDDSSEPVPFTSSKPVDNRPPTEECKQTSRESASTKERPRSNQVPVRNIVAMAGPKLEDAESNAAIRRACTVEAEAEFQLDEILMPDCSLKKN